MNANELKKARTAYLKQRYNCESGAKVDALGNRVRMLLTFEQWLDIWVSSGKFHLRGRTKGSYVMSRNGDIGHYEIGNVFIQQFSANVSESYKNRQRVYNSERQSATLSAQLHNPESSVRKALDSHEVKARKIASLKKSLADPSIRKFRSDSMRKQMSRPCTVDGITVFPSKKALAKALGFGKAGTRHPNFRYT